MTGSLRNAECGMRIASKQRGFTLIEVLLAVVIAAGLLVVAISFYQRSADLRGQLLGESERLAAIRLVMDRMTGDLRTAIAEPRQGFTGTSDYMKFVHAGSPSPGNLGDGSMKLVTYSVLTNALASSGTNSPGTNGVIVGFNRVEAPLVEMRVASTNREGLSFNGAMDPAAMATNNFVEPLTRAIRFVQFRYFDGSDWSDSWDGAELPVGVEVTFGGDAVNPEDEEYSGELFRRTIYVPAGRAYSAWEDTP